MTTSSTACVQHLTLAKTSSYYQPEIPLRMRCTVLQYSMDFHWTMWVWRHCEITNTLSSNYCITAYVMSDRRLLQVWLDHSSAACWIILQLHESEWVNSHINIVVLKKSMDTYSELCCPVCLDINFVGNIGHPKLTPLKFRLFKPRQCIMCVLKLFYL